MDSMNSRTHMEQGLNPSKRPSASVKAGNPDSCTLRRPNQRVSMLSGSAREGDG
jgi:hypothetical protein